VLGLAVHVVDDEVHSYVAEFSEKCARSDGATAVDKSVPVREILKLFKPRLKD
jgi:hypothetical protein